MGHESRVAVFVDAENVAQWVKSGGIDTLLEDLSSIGPVVVRKAYARWTNENMLPHQATLNRHGFELIHTFHPASGKNSADIQITVDVMEYASREDLACITLATGDSDFSPLFRRLREMGKQVIGVGPRSALSESVKSSCSRFIYTQTETASPTQDEATRASAFDDAADLLESTLKTFDGPANCSALKNRMLNIDSAFDEKAIGFKTFTAFVRAVEGVDLIQDDKTWLAYLQESETVPKTTLDQPPPVARDIETLDTTEGYRRILRKKHWRPIPGSALTRCFAVMRDLGPLPKSDLVEAVVARSEGELTTADVNKATQLLYKADLVHIPGKNNEDEVLWTVAEVSDAEMFHAVDRAMVARLTGGLEEIEASVKRNHVSPLLLGHYTDSELEALIAEAAELASNGRSSE